MPEENETNGPVSANGEEPKSGPRAPEEGEAAAPADPLAEAKAEAQRNKEQWMRTAADFDNFRKRSRREVEDARKGGREEMLKEFLPVFDNLERAIQSAQRAQEVKPVADGLNMILRQFLDTLGRVNIQKVPATGQQFDPAVHEAIQQVEIALAGHAEHMADALRHQCIRQHLSARACLHPPCLRHAKSLPSLACRGFFSAMWGERHPPRRGSCGFGPAAAVFRQSGMARQGWPG